MPATIKAVLTGKPSFNLKNKKMKYILYCVAYVIFTISIFIAVPMLLLTSFSWVNYDFQDCFSHTKYYLLSGIVSAISLALMHKYIDFNKL